MSKKAPHNGNRTPPGDTAIVKSTTAPAANQKTEAVDVVAEVKQGKPIKGTIQPGKKVGSQEAMDPVGKADADIDNDGDTDSTDKYLHNRRKAIRNKMKSKGKVGEKAVMHGGKSSDEKKNKETMVVGEER